MRALLVDTSTPLILAAVAEFQADGEIDIITAAGEVDARAHGELLAPAVDEVLREAAMKPRDLSAIVAGLGPGPYTGLRVGLVTAASMAQVLGVPTYGVCSLDAIGYAARAYTLVATDARRREIYWALYDVDGHRITEPAVDRPAAVAERIAGLSVAEALGDGAHLYARELLDLHVRAQPMYPTPYGLAMLAADRIRAGAPGERLTPLYLRRPDAVAARARKTVSQ